MLHASDLRRLNQIFEDFGRNPQGQLRLRWFDTSELSYFVEGSKEAPRAITVLPKSDSKIIDISAADPKILFVVTNDWDRHSWAERLGQGWVLARWVPPIPRDLHVSLYGEKAPWQPAGEYTPIENTYRAEGDPPNERATRLLKKLLLDMFHAGADPNSHPAFQRGNKQILDALLCQEKHRHDKTVEQIMDEFDDLYPAFGRLKPGSREGGVSFGGI